MRTISTRRLTVSLATAAAIVAAGCGGSDDDSSSEPTEPVADAGELVIDESAAGATPASETPATVVDDGTDISSDDPGTPDDTLDADGPTDEERALEFAACMRDEGIDWPDPSTTADGSIDLLGGQTLAQVAGASPDATQAAADVCSPLIAGASFLPGGGSGTFDSETQDLFVEFANCLRDEGLDVSDPDFSTGGNPLPGLFGPGFDPNDPDNAAAIDACSDIFAGSAIGDAAGAGG